jgi:hypothetical protein
MVVASRLGPKRSLIGPTLFPVYAFVLKMVLLYVLLPVFIFIIGPATLASTNGNWGKAIVITLGNLWSGGFIAAGVITLVFAILERTKVMAEIACKWDPGSLPPLEKPGQKTSMFQTVCELGFQVFGVVWLLLVPDHSFLLFGPASAFLAPGTIWHLFYLPIVLMSVIVIVRSVVILVRPQWRAFPLWSQIVQALLTLTVIHYMIEAAGTAGQPDWHPFVTLTAGARSPGEIVRLTTVVAVINVSALIALVCTWIGTCIGAAVHTWELLKYIGKQRSTHESASLQAQ